MLLARISRRSSPPTCENQTIEITSQQHFDADGQPLAVPVIPPDATMDEIEAIVAEQGADVLSDEQHGRLELQGVTRDGQAL